MSDAQAALVPENGVPPATQEQLIEEALHKVFVGNLAYSTTDDGLKSFFAPVQSDITSVQLILRDDRSAGYGFVAVSSAEAAQNAVDSLNGQELDGRNIIVEIARRVNQRDRKEKWARRRPGRRGTRAVPGEVTEAEANGDLKTDDAAAPPVTDDAAKPKKKKKKSARKPKRKTDVALEGEVPGETSDAPATSGATEALPTRKQFRPWRFRHRRLRPVGEDPVGEPSKTTLFVANLGFTIDDEGLTTLFTNADINVVSARVVRRKFGHYRRSKGYGFVDVGSEEEQQKAIAAIQGKEVEGRAVVVKIAVNTIKREEVDNAGPEVDAPAS